MAFLKRQIGTIQKLIAVSLVGTLSAFALMASNGLAVPLIQPEAVQPPQPSQPPQSPTGHLRVVDRAAFCSRLASVFTTYGQMQGFNKVQTTLMATGATAGVMQEFRAGRASDFINVAALEAYSAAPEKQPAEGYLPLAGIVGQAMGLGEVTLALSAAELRFIPYAQRGMDMVVITPNAAGMTPARAKMVSQVATGMNIKLHVVWVGENDDAALKEAQSLAWLAATTGGGFVNLGGRENPCAPLY